MRNLKAVFQALTLVSVLLLTTYATAKPRGRFSFGLSLDETKQKYEIGPFYKRTEVSTGRQITFSGFYKQDWWMLGISMGPGLESYLYEIGNRGTIMGTAAGTFVTEVTIAGFKSIYRSLYVTGGVMPSSHLAVNEGTQQHFAIMPFLGLAFCPKMNFTLEAHAGYDPLFQQTRYGLAFCF